MPTHRQIVRLLLLIDDETLAAVQATPSRKTVTISSASIKAALGRVVPERIEEMLVQLMDNGQVHSWRKDNGTWVVRPSAKLLAENRAIAFPKPPFDRAFRQAKLINVEARVALELRIAVDVDRQTGEESPSASTLARVTDRHAQMLAWQGKATASGEPHFCEAPIPSPSDRFSLATHLSTVLHESGPSFLVLTQALQRPSLHAISQALVGEEHEALFRICVLLAAIDKSEARVDVGMAIERWSHQFETVEAAEALAGLIEELATLSLAEAGAALAVAKRTSTVWRQMIERAQTTVGLAQCSDPWLRAVGERLIEGGLLGRVA